MAKELIWLGFGRLAPGAWVSPHNRQAELQEIFTELKVQQFVEVFSSKHVLGSVSAQELIQRCWDLPGLEAEYHKFVNHYRPQYQACLAQNEDMLKTSPEACFVRRIWLAHDFQPFPRKDPNLPTELMPPDWIGFTARELFDNYRRLLGTYCDDFIDTIIKGDL